MIFSTPAKHFSWAILLFCAISSSKSTFASIKNETTKHGINGFAREIESLVPQSIVDDLLQTYSVQEKSLIQDDLKNIRTLCFREKTPCDQKDQTYIATAGGPGACKSTILESYIHDKQNFVYADPDPRALKFMVNTYHQSLSYHQISKNASYSDLLRNAYNKWRNGSNYIANSILNEAYAGGYNIAHGTTMTSPNINLLLGKMKQKNYKIVLLLCSAPDDTRVKAIEHREKIQAFVQSSTEDLVGKGKLFAERFPVYFQYADEILFYWTQDFLQGSTHAATYSKNAGLVVHDNDALSCFAQKYDTDRNSQQLSFDELTKKTL